MRSPLLRLSLCLLLPSVWSLSAAAAEGPRPFTIDDLVRLQRVADPALSPDGRTVVFNVRETDMVANRGRTDLWSLDLAAKGAQPRRLTTHRENDSSPEWSADGREIYFLSTRSGSSQVWRLPANGGEAIQVTDLPIDVGTFRLAANAGRIAVTLDVFPDCPDLACSGQRASEKPKDTGQVYDRIFVRHWDTWSNGTISQLFVLKLSNGLATDPVSVSAALDADVPSKPFGDASEYTFTPDGSKLVFSARLKGKSEPWSTNFDLYEVAVDGSGLRNRTEDNPAWDTQPVFSRDGTQLAWRAMDRASFESDRFHIVIDDLKTGQRRALTKDWDRSVDSMAFSNDGRTLYVATDHFGQHPLWGVDVKTGKPTMLTGPGRVESFSVGEKDIVMATSSLKSPAELQALTIKSGDLRALPRINESRAGATQARRARAVHIRGRERRHGVWLRDEAGQLQTRREISGGFHRSRRSAGLVRQLVELSLESADVRGRGLCHGVHRFPRLDWLRPGVHRCRQSGLGRQAARRPAEGLGGGARELSVARQLAHVRARCVVRRLHDELDGPATGTSPFKCFVTHAGIFDTRAMAYSTEELWFDEWERGGLPFEVPENVEKHNPVNHVRQWSKPMLVIHGLKDYRVPYAQGISAFTLLQRRGIPSRLVIFPDENHWILKPNNSIRWHREVEKWLNQWTQSSGE